ncbi:MAG: DUF6787 family protein [Cytophagales bacterium]|nr:DUF6787 family protein [Cytophagales bacterium]
MTNFTDKLKARWNVKSTGQVVIILVVFAFTGTTVALIAKPLLRTLFSPNEVPLWATIAYYIFILPLYNLLLLFYGFLFGQFGFFWDFEKRFFARIFGVKKKHEN